MWVTLAVSLSTRESQLTEAYDICKSLDLSSDIFFVNCSCKKFDSFAIFDVVCISGHISVRVLPRRFQHPTNGQTFGFVFSFFWFIHSETRPSNLASPSRALELGKRSTMRKPSCKIEIYRNWDGNHFSSIPSKRYSTATEDGQPSSFYSFLLGFISRWKDFFAVPVTLVIPFDLGCDEMQTSPKTVTLWTSYSL